MTTWLTWPFINSFYSDETAFARTLKYDPNHGRALAHVGEARCATAHNLALSVEARSAALDEGIALLRRSQEVRPRNVTIGKLAYALMKRGRATDWDEIRRLCAPFASVREGAVVPDEKGQALEALGTAELRSREWNAAATHLAQSILAPKRFYSPEDAKLKLAFALHNGGNYTAALRLFEALARSPRGDISARATEVQNMLRNSPKALLFW